MSEAITLALYILVCKEMGEAARFPGNKYFYNSVDDNSYAVSLADMSVWASTHDHTKNEASFASWSKSFKNYPLGGSCSMAMTFQPPSSQFYKMRGNEVSRVTNPAVG